MLTAINNLILVTRRGHSRKEENHPPKEAGKVKCHPIPPI